MKAKEYLAVTSIDVKEFNKLVNEHLLKGWSIQGGVSMTTVDTPLAEGGIHRVIHFAQALVR